MTALKGAVAKKDPLPVVAGRLLDWVIVPFLIFVLLVAIGMDYNIFIMGRIKEEVAGSDVRTGVKRAVQYTGGIIASAGVIMASASWGRSVLNS